MSPFLLLLRALGYSWHGASARAVFQDEDDNKIVRKVPLAIALLKNGLHKTMAEKGVEIMGDNLSKMCLVMSDAAALDVARHMYTVKKEMVDGIDKTQHTPDQIEVFETEFVAQCINHGGDNASKQNYAAMAVAMKQLVIKYNCATLLQHWAVTRLLWKRMQRASPADSPAPTVAPTEKRFAQFFCLTQAQHGPRDEVWKGLLRKVLTGATGRGRFHCAMELQTSHHGGTEHLAWVITGEVDDVWAMMRSMSNLVSNQGSHSKYFLNEAKQMRCDKTNYKTPHAAPPPPPSNFSFPPSLPGFSGQSTNSKMASPMTPTP